MRTNTLKDFFSGYTTYTPTITTEFQALKHQTASIGFGAMHPSEHCDPLGRGIILNNEFIFKNDKKDFVYSPQLSVFYNFLLVHGGVKLSFYTNFQDGGNIQFTPEVGIGYILFFLTYGRNIPIMDNNLIPVNKNNISLKILMPFGYIL